MNLLERDNALSQLDAALQDATAGHGGVVLISGEAGIGKTALVERFMREHGATARLLWGACEALFTPRPLAPLFDIAAQTGGDLLRLLTNEAPRAALFAAFLNELHQQPSAVIFEDVHWADEATLDLLRFLSRRIQRVPALLVLTYRDDELDLRHPLRLLLGGLGASAATRRIALPPLSQAAVRQLIGNCSLDPAALHRQTGGNPFFVTETIASEANGIPASVRDAVLARAARLSAPGRAVLDAAAVIGPRIEPRLLASVVHAEAAVVDACIAVGMLVGQAETLAFRHELARQTILESISPQQRLAWHRLILERLEARPTTRGDLARLAHHAEAADDRAAVWEYAPAAARQAAAASAHREAAAHYARALRFADGLPPDDHALLLEAYAQECNTTEQIPEAIAARHQAIDIWRTAGNRLKQGENLATLAALLSGDGQTAEAEQASQAAIALLETLPPSRELGLAYRVTGMLCQFRRDSAAAIRWCEQAIALAERFHDDDTLAMAYNMIGSAQMMDIYEQGCATLEHSLAIAREAGLDLRVATAYGNLGSVSGEVYQFAHAERYLNEGIAFTQDRDLDAARLYMQAWLALIYLYTGRWDAAAGLADTVLQHPGVAAISRIMALVAVGRLRTRRGEPGGAAALAPALELAIHTDHLQRLGAVQGARAEAMWLAGNHTQLLAETQAVYELAVSKQHACFAGALGFWRWRAGEPASLPPWAARPFALQVAGEWQAAADAWQRLGCPYERALALMDGDHAAQQDALTIFEQLGARPAAALVQQKLHALPQRQRDKAAFGGLTVREREAATLIAHGHSNREVAAAMQVGVKTVETYVTRILAKLRFESRVQIATWAVEKGLVQPPQHSDD